MTQFPYQPAFYLYNLIRDPLRYSGTEVPKGNDERDIASDLIIGLADPELDGSLPLPPIDNRPEVQDER